MKSTLHNYSYYTLMLFVLLVNLKCAPSKKNINNDQSQVKDMIKSGKKNIVQKAREIIYEDIEQKVPQIYKTKVFAKDNSIIVLFDLPIKFARKNSSNYYNASVDLISGSTTYQPIINTEKEIDASKHFPFYQPNKRDKKWIDFVLQANDKDSKHFTDTKKTMTIIEQDTFLDVKVLSPSQSTRYKVDKTTGVVSESSHRHIKTETLLEQGYSEIKE